MSVTHSRMDELDPTEKRGEVGVLLRHARFVGPNSLMEPRLQVHVVGNAPGQLLRRVHMRVDEPYNPPP